MIYCLCKLHSCCGIMDFTRKYTKKTVRQCFMVFIAITASLSVLLVVSPEESYLVQIYNNTMRKTSQRNAVCHDSYIAQAICNVTIITPACMAAKRDIYSFYTKQYKEILPLIQISPKSNSTTGELILNGTTALKWNHPGKPYLIYGEINVTACTLHLHKVIFPSTAANKIEKIYKYSKVTPADAWRVWIAEGPLRGAVHILLKRNFPYVSILRNYKGGFAAISHVRNQGAIEFTLSGSQVATRTEKIIHKGKPFIFEPVENLTHADILENHPDVCLGGSWSPADCTGARYLSIIIPYRNRYNHLLVFLNYIYSFLKLQKANFDVFLIEQAEPVLFNRAALMNAGYRESRKVRPYDCYIFHDIDLLPEDLTNIYKCDNNPQHLVVSRNTTKYRESLGRYWKYQYFGGAVAMSSQHIEKINGFPNDIFGWGGEDDEIAHRIHLVGMNISEYPPEISMYNEIQHGTDKGNPHLNNTLRFYQHHAAYMMYSDGLNSTNYTVLSVSEEPLFTRIYVELKGPVTQLEQNEYYNSINEKIKRKQYINNNTIQFT